MYAIRSYYGGVDGPFAFASEDGGAFGGGYTYRPRQKGGALDEIGFTVHYLYNKDIPPDFPKADAEAARERMIETAAEANDDLTEKYLENGTSYNFV